MKFQRIREREKKTIVHLTALENLEGVFQYGLLPRSRLKAFRDVADPAIIEGREGLGLEDYVPFHFFTQNPFDGAVVESNPGIALAYLVMRRTVARDKGFLILPRHPLAQVVGIPLAPLPYDEGFKAIDWDLLERRDYQKRECRLACMAECLAPGAVSLADISSITVQDQPGALLVKDLQKRYPSVYKHFVDIKPKSFPKHD